MYINGDLQYKRTRLKEIKNFHNAIVRKDNKQEGRFKSSDKVYMRQQRSVMACYVPRSTVHIHYNPWRLLGVKNNYYKENEILKFGNEAIKYKNRNIDEVKMQKDWKIKKLAQGNRNRCKAKKLKKLIVLNYTERGKQQKIYNCFYTISIPKLIFKVKLNEEVMYN